MPKRGGGLTGSQRKAAKLLAQDSTKSRTEPASGSSVPELGGKPRMAIEPAPGGSVPNFAGKPTRRSTVDEPVSYKIFSNPSLLGCVKGAVALTERQVRETNYANKAGIEKRGKIRYVDRVELSSDHVGQQGSLIEIGTSPPRCYNFREYRGELWSDGDTVTFEITPYKGKDPRLVGSGVAIRLSSALSK